MEPLELELAPVRQRLDRPDRVGIMRGEGGVDDLGIIKQPRGAGEIADIGAQLAGEHRVIGIAAHLAELDLAVPVSALDQPHHQPAAMAPRQIGHPVAQRNTALLIGLHGKAKAVPAIREQHIIGHHLLDDVEREFEPLGLLGIQGEVNARIARHARQLGDDRHQRRHRHLRLAEFVARMQRGELDRDARPAAHPAPVSRQLPNRARVGEAVALSIGVGHRRLAKHVEGVREPLLHLRRGALQRLLDGAAKNELAAKDAHCLQGRRADHRLAQPPGRPLQRAGKARLRAAPAAQHLAGQHQRESGGVDEGALAQAKMLGPVVARKLVADERVAGRLVGHAQQRFGKAHQRYAFLGPEAVGLQERIEPRRLAPARVFDQPRGEARSLLMHRARFCRILKRRARHASSSIR